MSEMTLIEINGVKMEVDLRQAKIVHENLRVGTKIKILVKNDYSEPAVWPGVIVGFEPFPSMPTIIVAYMDTSYSGGLKFAHINSTSAKRYELVPSVDDELPIAKEDVLSRFDRDIDKKEAELNDLQSQRAFFLRHFNAYFEHFATKAE
jgi:hypothetical protein